MRAVPRLSYSFAPMRSLRRFHLKGSQPPRSPRHGRSRGNGESYPAGTSVRQSGIYEVVHHREHRPAHEVVMLAEDVFPTCDTCGEQVRFRLVRTAPYIFQDADFEDPE